MMSPAHRATGRRIKTTVAAVALIMSLAAPVGAIAQPEETELQPRSYATATASAQQGEQTYWTATQSAEQTGEAATAVRSGPAAVVTGQGSASSTPTAHSSQGAEAPSSSGSSALGRKRTAAALLGAVALSVIVSVIAYRRSGRENRGR